MNTQQEIKNKNTRRINLKERCRTNRYLKNYSLNIAKRNMKRNFRLTLYAVSNTLKERLEKEKIEEKALKQAYGNLPMARSETLSNTLKKTPLKSQRRQIRFIINPK